MKDSVQRYYVYFDGEPLFDECDCGDWVCYEDHAELCQKMQDEIDRLQSELEDAEQKNI